jgi:RNA polymerase sigma factor (sigma-70 family)
MRAVTSRTANACTNADMWREARRPAGEGGAVMLPLNQKLEQVVLPHLDAAYNLALWLMRDQAAAEDVVQDAVLCALPYYGPVQGGDSRVWLLRLVRNNAYGRLERQRRPATQVSLDNVPALTEAPEFDGYLPNPVADLEIMAPRQQDLARLEAVLAALPTELRECLVLREQEQLGYQEIALITQVPVGTVMSRLRRAHTALLPVAARLASGGAAWRDCSAAAMPERERGKLSSLWRWPAGAAADSCHRPAA